MLKFVDGTSENIFFCDVVIKKKLAYSSLYLLLPFSYERCIVRERGEEKLNWEVIVQRYTM